MYRSIEAIINNTAKATITATLNMYRRIVNMDRFAVMLLLTRIWATAGLYMAKIFEFIFRMILKLPNSWIFVADHPRRVKILAASDGRNDITNKFKLFLKFYWRDNAEEIRGFNFRSLQQLLNCSVLYCSYLLINENNKLSPEEFWATFEKFYIEINGKECKKMQSGNVRSVPFGIVDFFNNEGGAPYSQFDPQTRNNNEGDAPYAPYDSQIRNSDDTRSESSTEPDEGEETEQYIRNRHL